MDASVSEGSGGVIMEVGVEVSGESGGGLVDDGGEGKEEGTEEVPVQGWLVL